MAATLTEALSNVRSLIDEPVAQFWSDAELTEWINQGCADCQREVEWARAGPTGIDTTAGTQTYYAPQNLLRLYRLEFVPNNNTSYTYSLEFRGYNEMDAAWGNLKTLPSAYPEQFTLWNNPKDTAADVGLTILLYPVPAVDGYLNVYYYRTIVPVVEDSDNIDVLPGWEDTIYSFAAYRALRKDADSRWQDFKADYTTQVEQMKSVSRTFTDQPNWFSTGQQNYNPLFLDLDE